MAGDSVRPGVLNAASSTPYLRNPDGGNQG